MDRISKSKQRLARRLRFRDAREREGLALAEGPRVIGEALMSTVEVRWVLMGGDYAAGRIGRAIVAACRERGVECLRVRGAEVEALCSTYAPVPVLACVRPPPRETRALERGRYLVAGDVQMPGNLGTLIRSAWGFGLDGVVIGAGTVDPWNAKVVRSSAGAVFHMPLMDEPAAPRAERSDRINVLCADPAGAPVDAVEEARAQDWVLVVGNEVGGISSPIGSRGRAVSISLAEGVDSLNVAVAGSILMYELTRAGR